MECITQGLYGEDVTFFILNDGSCRDYIPIFPTNHQYAIGVGQPQLSGFLQMNQCRVCSLYNLLWTKRGQL